MPEFSYLLLRRHPGSCSKIIDNEFAYPLALRDFSHSGWVLHCLAAVWSSYDAGLLLSLLGLHGVNGRFVPVQITIITGWGPTWR